MEHQYILTLEFDDQTEPDLLEVSSLFYDLNLAYDFAVLTRYQKYYKGYSFDRFFWFRNGRPIKSEHKLRAFTIKKQSPLILEVVVPLIGCAWVLLQIFQKVQRWPLEKEKLELEVSKLRREEQKHRDQVADDYVSQMGRIVPEADDTERKIINNLSRNSCKLENVSIQRYEERVNKKRQSDA